MNFMRMVSLLCVVVLAGCSGRLAEADANSAADVTGPQVMMFKAVGSLQCGGGALMTKRDLNREVAALERAGVQVRVAQCAHDGMMRPAMCGADSGELWLMAVAAESVPAAQSLGYEAVAPSDDFPVEVCR